MAKTIQERAFQLSKLGYTVELLKDKTTEGDFIYLARNPELDGCMAQGLTEEEAISNLHLVRVEHIEHLLEHNLPVPHPNHAIAGSAIKLEYIVNMDLPAITLSSSDYYVKAVQPNARELVYSRTPDA